jgi:hypothetical protein
MSNDLTLLVVVGDSAAVPDPLGVEATVDVAVRGISIDANMKPSGGEPPYTFAHTGGTLPAGTTLDTSTGKLLGTPTTQGTYEFEVTVTDALSNTFAALFSLAITGGFGWVSPPQIPTAEHAIAYSYTFSASGGVSPYTYSIQNGTPHGSLTLSGANAGLYTRASPNAPTITTRNTFTLRVTDNTGNYVDRMFVEYTLPPLQLLSITYPLDGMVGLPYSTQFVHQYGLLQPYAAIEPQVQWTVTSGTMPPGLSLNPLTGFITGAPSSAGFFSWDITLTDPIGASIVIPCVSYIHAVTDIDKIFTTTFGDGLSSNFVINHALQIVNIAPRSVFIYDASLGTPYPRVEFEWDVVDQDNIEVKAVGVPSVGQYLIVIVG